MHFHLFGPPPLHLLPMLLTAALAFAAGMFFVARRGMPQAFAGLSDRCGQRLAFWRKACGSARRDGSHGCFEARASRDLGNSAFNDYRRETLKKLEDEAAEFRKFLDSLRRAADAADFEAFLKARRDNAPSPEAS
jgi:hypothetical protein